MARRSWPPPVAFAAQVLPALYAAAADSYKVELTRAGVADGAGRAVVDFAPIGNDIALVVSRVRVWMTGTALQPSGRLFVLGGRFQDEDDATQLIGTATADRDMAEGEPHTFYPGQVVRFVWEDASPGAVGTCVLEAAEVPLTVDV